MVTGCAQKTGKRWLISHKAESNMSPIFSTFRVRYKARIFRKNNPDKTNTCHLRMNRGTWANENKRPLHDFKAAVKGKLRLVIYSRQTCHCCHTWALTWFLLCNHGRKLKWCGCHYCRYYITEIFREGESRHAAIIEKGKNKNDVQNDSGKSQDSEKDYLCKTNYT